MIHARYFHLNASWTAFYHQAIWWKASIKDFVMSDHSVIDGYGSVNSCNIMTIVRHAP